jgi:hypothetical protein
MRKMKGRIAYHFVVFPQVDLLAGLGSSPSVLHILKIVLYLHSPQHISLQHSYQNVVKLLCLLFRRTIKILKILCGSPFKISVNVRRMRSILFLSFLFVPP